MIDILPKKTERKTSRRREIPFGDENEEETKIRYFFRVSAGGLDALEIAARVSLSSE